MERPKGVFCQQCRLCLRFGGLLTPILYSNDIQDSFEPTADKIHYYTSLKVTESDHLTSVCKECNDFMNECIRFKNQCLHNDEYQQNYRTETFVTSQNRKTAATSSIGHTENGIDVQENGKPSDAEPDPAACLSQEPQPDCVITGDAYCETDVLAPATPSTLEANTVDSLLEVQSNEKRYDSGRIVKHELDSETLIENCNEYDESGLDPLTTVKDESSFDVTDTIIEPRYDPLVSAPNSDISKPTETPLPTKTVVYQCKICKKKRTTYTTLRGYKAHLLKVHNIVLCKRCCLEQNDVQRCSATVCYKPDSVANCDEELNDRIEEVYFSEDDSIPAERSISTPLDDPLTQEELDNVENTDVIESEICKSPVLVDQDYFVKLNQEDKSLCHACDVCGERFPTNILLRDHQMIIGHNTFNCDLCDKRYFTKIGIDNHLSRLHPTHQCHLCGKKVWKTAIHLCTVQVQVCQPCINKSGTAASVPSNKSNVLVDSNDQAGPSNDSPNPEGSVEVNATLGRSAVLHDSASLPTLSPTKQTEVSIVAELGCNSLPIGSDTNYTCVPCQIHFLTRKKLKFHLKKMCPNNIKCNLCGLRRGKTQTCTIQVEACTSCVGNSTVIVPDAHRKSSKKQQPPEDVSLAAEEEFTEEPLEASSFLQVMYGDGQGKECLPEKESASKESGFSGSFMGIKEKGTFQDLGSDDNHKRKRGRPKKVKNKEHPASILFQPSDCPKRKREQPKSVNNEEHPASSSCQPSAPEEEKAKVYEETAESIGNLETVLNEPSLNELALEYLEETPAASKDVVRQLRSGFVVKRVPKKVDRPCKCSVCDKIFPSKQELTTHEFATTHSRHPCEHCTHSFASVKSLEQHFVKRHKRYPCAICERSYTKQYGLNKHMAEGKHTYFPKTSSGNFLCNICAQPFKNKRYLLTHLKLHAHFTFIGEKFSCNICNETIYARGLVGHLHGKHPDFESPVDPTNTYTCAICNRRFSSKKLVRCHIDSIHNATKYKCNLCNRFLSTAQYLSVHMRKMHTKPRTIEKIHKCPVCPKMFRLPEHVKRHVRSHTGEAPYRCRFCDRAFTLLPNMKGHERQHTGVKPYKCEVCGAAFRHNVSKKNHMKYHQDVPGVVYNPPKISKRKIKRREEEESEEVIAPHSASE